MCNYGTIKEREEREREEREGEGKATVPYLFID
jgi:glutaredoxin